MDGVQEQWREEYLAERTARMEANGREAVLQQRVEELERERDHARDAYTQWAELYGEAEARERALQQRVEELEAIREELEGAAQFDKAVFAGERRLTQGAVTRALEAEARERVLREALERIVPLTDVHEALGVSALHSVIRDICNIARAALSAHKEGD